jgi:Mg-chelatase subunit ChlD
MARKHERVRESVLRFIDALDPGDRIRIGTFGGRVSLSPHLTGDRGILRRVVREEFWPGGFTPLWRAIAMAMDSLASEQGRLVVLVLTDGFDSTSGHRLGLRGGSRSLVNRFERDNRFMIHAIGYHEHRGLTLEPALIRLASISGGAHIELPSDADLTSAFARIADELRSQYLLAFAPPVLDGRQRRLEVSSNVPNLTVRARRVYTAGGGT